MILETSFVIDFLNGKRDAVSKISSLIDEKRDCIITTPTIFEVWSGIISLKKGENEKTKMKLLLNNQIIYGLDTESAEIAGKIHGELVLKGLTIDPADCMIAGIAISNNLPLLTRDGHFNRIEGLKVEGY